MNDVIYFCSACIKLGLNLLVTHLYVANRLESNDRNRIGHWLNRLVMWKYTKKPFQLVIKDWMYLFRTNLVLEINWTCTIFNNTYIYVSKFYTYFKFLFLSPCDTEIQSDSLEDQVFLSLYYVQTISGALQFPSHCLLMEALRSWI